MTKESTRDQIIQYLTKSGSASASEICDALRTSKSNIQYHLNILLDDQVVLIDHNFPKNINEVGRPSLHYAIVPNEMPDNITNLAAAFLQIGIIDDDARLAATASNLLPVREIINRENFTLLISDLMTQMNKYHYQAHWEAHQKGPVIIFKNCPYRSLIADFPRLCILDLCIIKTWLTADVIQTAKIDPKKWGPICVFQINR